MTREQEAWERGRGLWGNNSKERRGKREEARRGIHSEEERRGVLTDKIQTQQQEESKARGALTCTRTYSPPTHEHNTLFIWMKCMKMWMKTYRCWWTVVSETEEGLACRYQPIPGWGLNREGGPCWDWPEICVCVCKWMTLQLRQWNSITAAIKYSQWNVRADSASCKPARHKE